MSGQPVSALQHALALVQAPRGGRPRSDERLPEGILLLVKLVAGEEQASVAAQAATGESAQAVREAAGFYIQQVMFAPDSDSYRVLGVDPAEGDERIREHYRWLARWLHPDRNPDAWEVVYADRVNQAWQNLRTPDRRERYDAARADVDSVDSGAWPGADVAVAAPPVAAAKRPAVYSDAPATSVDLRWVPRAIFLSLGVTAVAVVAIFSAVRWSEPGTQVPVAEVEAEPVAPVPAPVVAASPETVEAVEPLAPLALVESAPVEPEPLSLPVAEALPEATPSPAPPLAPPPRVAAAFPAPPRASPGPSKPTAVPTVAPAPPPPVLTARQAREFARAERREAARQAAVAAAASAAQAREANRAQPAPVETQPVAVAVAERTLVTTAPRIGQSDANRLLNHFSRAYAEGDLDGMRAMFASDARGARGNRDEILAEYNRLFDSSTERSLQVRDVSWFESGELLTIVASFEATVTSNRGGRPRRTRGDLRLDLRREDTQWRIVRLQHGQRPG